MNTDYECMSSLGALMNHLSALAVAALLLGVACSSSPSIRDCAQDSDCGAGSLCHQGACAANAPPVADLPAPVAPTTHRLVTLAPETMDPEGRPVTHRWTILAAVGGCEPDVEPAAGGALNAIFWCPGTYEATVVPVDDLGLEGAPAVATFEVAAATGAPTVEAGPAISATHRCEGTPLACQVLGPAGSPALELRAVGTEPDGAPLTWGWRALPPAGVAEDPSLSVTFAPGADAAQVTANISNTGGAIAGLYRFRIRAEGPSGLIGQAVQQVVVANTAPTVAFPPAVLRHRYLDGTFVAEGERATGALDPDGDALIVSAAITPAPAAGCTEEAAPASVEAVHLLISCPVASELIGDAVRMLTLTVEDVNGATASASAPITISNEPPAIVTSRTSFLGLMPVGHRVEPCTLATGAACFVADGTDPFVVHDPDGDPLSHYQLGATVAADRTSSRGTIALDSEEYGFRFETPTSLPLQFMSTTGASGFSLNVTVQDPWGATASASLKLLIGNRPPVVKEAAPAVQVPHAYDAATRRYVATTEGALFEDPDGDPLDASSFTTGDCDALALVAGRAVIDCALAWDYSLGGLPPLAAFATLQPVAVEVADGWSNVRSSTNITILDRPATVTVPVTSVESCRCASDLPCWKYALSTSGVPIPALITDPDGDPSLVTLYLSGSSPTPATVTCLPGWCYPRADGAGGISGILKAQQGGSSLYANTTFDVSPRCSTAGTCCTP